MRVSEERHKVLQMMNIIGLIGLPITEAIEQRGQSDSIDELLDTLGSNYMELVLEDTTILEPLDLDLLPQGARVWLTELYPNVNGESCWWEKTELNQWLRCSDFGETVESTTLVDDAIATLKRPNVTNVMREKAGFSHRQKGE